MNPKKLPPRLQTALSLAESAVLADIGCDHAYLPIAACLANICKRAVACDANKGPLERARKNISDFGLQNRIDVRLGDGLAPLEAGEADCIVIAGMGGMRMLDILTEGAAVARKASKLILQPQHDLIRLKDFLRAAGFIIYEETDVEDSGKHYSVIAAKPAQMK